MSNSTVDVAMCLRLRELRKALGMTMERFGKLLGLSRSGVSDIESQQRRVTEKHVLMLCRMPIEGRCVSEVWLRTGEGQMFLSRTRDEELSDFVEHILYGESDTIQRRVVSALSRLTVEQWKLVSQLIDQIATENVDALTRESIIADVDREVEEYRRQLLLERGILPRSEDSLSGSGGTADNSA